MTNFNDTMTDIALALIDLTGCDSESEFEDIASDILTAASHLTDDESADLMPRLEKAVSMIQTHIFDCD